MYSDISSWHFRVFSSNCFRDMWCFFRFPPLWPGVPVTLPLQADKEREWLLKVEQERLEWVRGAEGSQRLKERLRRQALIEPNGARMHIYKNLMNLMKLAMMCLCSCAIMCPIVPLFSKTMGCARLVARLRSCLRRRMMELATSQRSTAWASWRTATLGPLGGAGFTTHGGHGGVCSIRIHQMLNVTTLIYIIPQ